MGLYGQEPEVRLLTALLRTLETKTVIEVGAELGSIAAPLLDAGVAEVHAIEPHPDNAAALRTRFQGDPRVTVHELAISDGDGEALLHVSTSPDGDPLSYGHSLLGLPDSETVTWQEPIPVTCRTLGGLVADGTLPKRAGLLMIDTEGNDLAVIRGMGDLQCDVVMVEHWSDLPHSLGKSPWTTDEMVNALHPRGYRDFLFMAHRGEFITVRWNDGDVATGHYGNLIFLHESVIEGLLPEAFTVASQLADHAVEVGEMYADAARERLALIEKLDAALNDRPVKRNEPAQETSGDAFRKFVRAARRLARTLKS